MKKTTKIKHFFVWVGVYRKQIMVVVNAKTMPEVIEYVSRLKIVKPLFKEGLTAMKDEKVEKGLCITLEGFPPFLIFPSYNKNSQEDVACIVHETSHAVDSIFHQCLIRDEEARAYLHEYLFTFVKEGLDAKTK